MNDELSEPTETRPPSRPLEARPAHRPEVLARLHQLADTLDQSAGDDGTAEQAEERVSAQVRQLAREVLPQWAHEANAHAEAMLGSHVARANQLRHRYWLSLKLARN